MCRTVITFDPITPCKQRDGTKPNMLKQHEIQCSMHARYQIFSCLLARFLCEGKIAHKNAPTQIRPTLVTSRNRHSTQSSNGHIAYLWRADVLLPNNLCALTPGA